MLPDIIRYNHNNGSSQTGSTVIPKQYKTTELDPNQTESSESGFTIEPYMDLELDVFFPPLYMCDILSTMNI